jgi:hypothetical protein
MGEDPQVLDASGREADGEQALIFALEPETEAVQAPRWSLQALRDRQERFEKSAAGRYWAHLSTADELTSRRLLSSIRPPRRCRARW